MNITQEAKNNSEQPTTNPPKGWKSVTDHPHEQIIGDTSNQVEPKNINEALKDESWMEAMIEELSQFEKSQVWKLVPYPQDKTIIGTRWVFRNKLNENGKVIRNKARLVAQGYNQQEVTTTIVPFADIAPTVSSNTQKTLSMERPPTKRRTTTARQKSTMKTSDSSRPKPTTPTRRSSRHATTSPDSTQTKHNPEKSQTTNLPPSSTQAASVPQTTKPSSSHISTQSSEGNSPVSSSFQAYDHPSEVSTKEFISDDDVRSLYNDKWRSLPIVSGKSVNLDSYSIWGYDLNELATATGLRARSAPYGMLLTKIFKPFNVPLDDEDSFEINKILDASKLRRMKIPSLKRAPSPKPETKSKRRRLVKQYVPTEPLPTGIDSSNSPNSLTTNCPLPLSVALPNTADLESPQKSSPVSPHNSKSISPNSKEIAKPSPETTQCIDLTSTSPILVESSPQTVVISHAPVSLQTETLSNVENLSTLKTSDTDMVNIFAFENLLSSPPAAPTHQPHSPLSPHTPASNPNPDAQLSSLISMLEAELFTPPPSNQITSIIPHVVTYTSPSMTTNPVTTTSPLNSPKSYKEPSPPRIQLTSINHTDSDDLTSQIEAFFNNSIQLPEQTGVTKTYAMPSVSQSDPYAFQANSPIFSSPKEEDDNSFNVQTLLAPRYDSSPPRNTTHNSNTLPQEPIISFTSSFFNNFPSIGNRPPTYPRTTISSDPIKPHQDITLRSIDALQKQGMTYQEFWVNYITEHACPRVPGMPALDPSQIQFPILPLSSEATSDDEPYVP
ncbi:uncharacterized protein LOC131604609 [Vicia villosa]|uniref:uncharacterized protein LOC131604609 n=1 Tax=Vicia villosa TaxID=3911 RepID=UPI00273C3274|nr:uncharacterized protein LOC131604609 [Vicia villosa]